MKQIYDALMKGYAPNQILQFLTKNHPTAKDAVNKVLGLGYTADVVLRYLVDPKDTSDENKFTPYHQKIAHENRKQENKVLLAGGVLAGGALAGIASRSMASQELPSLLPDYLSEQSKIPYEAQNQPQLTYQQPNKPSPQLPNTPNAPIIPPYEHDPKKSIQIVNSLKDKKNLDQIVRSGLELPAMIDSAEKILSKPSKTILSNAPGGLEQVIKDYMDHSISQEKEESELRLKKAYDEELKKKYHPIKEEKKPEVKKEKLLVKEKERFEKEYGTKSSEDAAFIEEIKKLLEM